MELEISVTIRVERTDQEMDNHPHFRQFQLVAVVGVEVGTTSIQGPVVAAGALPIRELIRSQVVARADKGAPVVPKQIHMQLAVAVEQEVLGKMEMHLHKNQVMAVLEYPAP